MNDFVKWWIVQYLKVCKVGGVKSIWKTIVFLKNMNCNWERILKEYKLEKCHFIDSELARNFISVLNLLHSNVLKHLHIKSFS